MCLYCISNCLYIGKYCFVINYHPFLHLRFKIFSISYLRIVFLSFLPSKLLQHTLTYMAPSSVLVTHVQIYAYSTHMYICVHIYVNTACRAVFLNIFLCCFSTLTLLLFILLCFNSRLCPPFQYAWLLFIGFTARPSKTLLTEGGGDLGISAALTFVGNVQ